MKLSISALKGELGAAALKGLIEPVCATKPTPGVEKVCYNNEAATRVNRSSGFPTRSDINRPLQSQKQARSLKFWI